MTTERAAPHLSKGTLWSWLLTLVWRYGTWLLAFCNFTNIPGTTYSGYAYSFTADQDDIHIMRKWEGDDPGINNQKTPTVLLLTPDQEFHSFGFTARDFYHDLQQREAKHWLYFEKFKMLLHYSKVWNLTYKIWSQPHSDSTGSFLDSGPEHDGQGGKWREFECHEDILHHPPIFSRSRDPGVERRDRNEAWTCE